MASNSSPALEAFTARREVIAGDIAKLEKQVRRQRTAEPATASSAEAKAQPVLPVRPQIYELESVYFTADYTNFGNVVKASAAPPVECCRRRRRRVRRFASPPVDTPQSAAWPTCQEPQAAHAG